MSEIKTRNLPVKLMPDEVAAKSQELAGVIRDRKAAAESLANIQSQIKGEIKSLDRRVEILTANVLDKVEYRDVEILELRNNQSMTISTIRADTSETISTRPMTESERQLVFFPDRELREVGSGDEQATADSVI